MYNGVPLTVGWLSWLHAATDFHDVAAIGGRFYADGREAELKPVYVMGWEVNNLTLVGGLESIREGVGDVRNTYGEVVSGGDVDNHMGCGLL